MRSRLNLLQKTRSYSLNCPSCGSKDLVKIDEYYYKASGWIAVYECQGCRSLVEELIGY